MNNKIVVKYDGSEEPFNADKLFRWSQYACKKGGDWGSIALSTFSRLPDKVKSSDIHETMIRVCEETKDPLYTKIAARLEIASLRKNMERHLGVNVATDRFSTIYMAMLDSGVWCASTLPKYSAKMQEWWDKNSSIELQSWQVKQFDDKYSLRKNGVSVEVPHLAVLGIGLGLFGDTQEAYDFSEAVIKGKINLPTPLMNGSRNGDFDTVSCVVLESEDTIESIAAAEHLAMRMTAKKAGIGIKFNTRTKGSPVKGGAVAHLGKHSIYRSLAGAVGAFTQVSRGGSATVSFDVIDPEVYNIALWKSQRTDIRARLDWLDFSLCFNDAFIEAVVNRKPWYLFSMDKAPEVYEAFPLVSVESYNKIVEQAVSEGRHHAKVDAVDLVSHLLELRQETGRIYMFNLSRANEHTPFEDTIRLSNLCQLAA